MGYIEQIDTGNVYVTDINDWLATLSNLNRECKNYTDSEIRYKEIIAEHDKKIRADFAHELKETFNNEIPSNYASTQPFFTLENVRKLVDMVFEEQKGKINEYTKK